MTAGLRSLDGNSVTEGEAKWFTCIEIGAKFLSPIYFPTILYLVLQNLKSSEMSLIAPPFLTCICDHMKRNTEL